MGIWDNYESSNQPSCNSSRQWRAASGGLNLHRAVQSPFHLANDTAAWLILPKCLTNKLQNPTRGLNSTRFLNILNSIEVTRHMLNFPHRDLNGNREVLVRLVLEPLLPISNPKSITVFSITYRNFPCSFVLRDQNLMSFTKIPQ